MTGKAVISLTTGLEDSEKVTVAPGRGRRGRIEPADADVPHQGSRPTRHRRHRDRRRLRGPPPLADLVKRYEAAGGKYYVCPICFNAKHLDQASLIAAAELQGTIPMWAWIGDEGATTFSY